jgi:hypothetical protein
VGGQMIRLIVPIAASIPLATAVSWVALALIGF